MGSFLRLDSPFMQALRRAADFVLLNVLTIFCALPLVTLVAAAAALYDAVGHMKQNEGSPVRDFFRAFRANLKQGSALGLLFLASGLLLVYALVFYYSTALVSSPVMLVLTILVTILWAVVSAWVFPLQAKFNNTVRGTIRNALLCSIAYLPRSVLMAGLNLLPLGLALLAPYYFLLGGLLWFLSWFSLTAWINLRLLDKPLAKLMDSQPQAEAHPDSK